MTWRNRLGAYLLYRSRRAGQAALARVTGADGTR